MSIKREKAIDTVNDLPQEFELEELLEKLVFVEKVESGLKQVEAGQVVPDDKLKEMVKNGRNYLDRICDRGFKINSRLYLKRLKVYADRQVDKIIKRVDQVGTFPKSGRVVPEFDSELIRELIEGNYRIVYQISPDTIAIVRIHHAARQIK